MARTIPVVLLFVSGIAVSMGENVLKVIAEEGKDAMLPCSLGNVNIEQKVFDWMKGAQNVFLYDRGDHYNNGRSDQDEQFKGRVFHFSEKLKDGNASIVITNTAVADGGNYRCIFPHFQPRRTHNIWLVVRRVLKDRSSENTPGTALKPHIKILNATKDGVPLLCEVGDAFPEPTLEWQDCDGNTCHAEKPQVSERGGRYFVSLQATVTRTTTNRFRCVATQEDVYHRTHADIDVPGKMFEECNLLNQVGLLAIALILGVFIGVVLNVVVVFIRRRRRDRLQRDRGATNNHINQPNPDVPNGNVIQMEEGGGPPNGHDGQLSVELLTRV